MNTIVHIILWPATRINGHLLFAVKQEGHQFTVIAHPMATHDEFYPGVPVPVQELKDCIQAHLDMGCTVHHDILNRNAIVLLAPGKNVADAIELMMFFDRVSH